MAEGLTVALPLRLDEADGPYYIHKDMEDLATQHLKMIILTAPGERVMDPKFGVGMRNYLFEQITTSLSETIKTKIKAQVFVYAPFIKILEINVSANPDIGSLFLKIKYAVPNARIVSDLTIPISA